MDNIISIILKDQNKLKEQTEKNTKDIKICWNQIEITENGILKDIEKIITKIKKIKSTIKKLKIIITFLFFTNLTTIFLLWR